LPQAFIGVVRMVFAIHFSTRFERFQSQFDPANGYVRLKKMRDLERGFRATPGFRVLKEL